MLLRLDQISAHFGIVINVKPQKEVYTQSRNQGIFLQFWQTLPNGGPLRLELVAVGAGPLGHILILFHLRRDQRLITSKSYLFTIGQTLNPSSVNNLELH